MRKLWHLQTVLRDIIDEAPIGGTGEDLEQIEDKIEDAADEVDELVEQLAALDIISEERHNEITERLDTCLARMTELSSTATNAETPLLAQILTEVATIKADLQNLKLSVDSRLKDQIPNESQIQENPLSVEEDAQKEPETPEELPIPAKPTRSYRVV